MVIRWRHALSTPFDPSEQRTSAKASPFSRSTSISTSPILILP